MIVSEHERAHPSPLTQLYRQTGLFTWTGCLREMGAESPARVVFIIDRCMVEPETALQSDALAALRGHGDPTVVVRQVLASAHQRYATAQLRFSLPKAGPAGSLRTDWCAHDALAELMAVELGPTVMRYAQKKLGSKGFRVEDDVLHDLAALFANMHLRGALCSFDPARGEGNEGAWLGTVFYRYALRHVATAGRMQELTDLLESELPDPGSAPEELLEQQAVQATLQSLPALLSGLPRLQRQALSLYYGFEDREHTVAEVAAALETNVYFARAALVSGLGAMAAATGTQGLLNQQELALADAVFLQGRSAGDLAREKGLEETQVRRHLSAMTRKLQAALRRRTHLYKTVAQPKEELDALSQATPQPGT